MNVKRLYPKNHKTQIITAVSTSQIEQRNRRKKVYSWLIAMRIPPLLLSLLLYTLTKNSLLSLLIVLFSAPLPWIAVIIANTKSSKRSQELGPYESIIRQREADKIKLKELH